MIIYTPNILRKVNIVTTDGVITYSSTLERIENKLSSGLLQWIYTTEDESVTPIENVTLVCKNALIDAIPNTVNESFSLEDIWEFDSSGILNLTSRDIMLLIKKDLWQYFDYSKILEAIEAVSVGEVTTRTPTIADYIVFTLLNTPSTLTIDSIHTEYAEVATFKMTFPEGMFFFKSGQVKLNLKAFLNKVVTVYPDWMIRLTYQSFEDRRGIVLRNIYAYSTYVGTGAKTSFSAKIEIICYNDQDVAEYTQTVYETLNSGENGTLIGLPRSEVGTELITSIYLKWPSAPLEMPLSNYYAKIKIWEATNLDIILSDTVVYTKI